MSKVSIVIPCYNVAEYIDDALTSALSQTYSNTEIICVDNGSTDSTLDYLKGYEQRGEIILLHEPKRGAPAARNLGWSHAAGDWIQFLDADDIILPEKIAHQLRLADKLETAPFVAAAATKIDLSDGASFAWPVHENVWHGLLQNQLGITTANLFRRSALEAVNGWDESLKSSQEYDLMFRIMKQNDSVLRDDEPRNSVIRTRPSGSISTIDAEGNKNRFLHLVSRIALYLKAERPNEYEALGKAYFQQMYLRIRLNTIDEQRDSWYFYQSILPSGFVPEPHTYDRGWFSMVRGLFGFRVADFIQSIASRLK